MKQQYLDMNKTKPKLNKRKKERKTIVCFSVNFTHIQDTLKQIYLPNRSENDFFFYFHKKEHAHNIFDCLEFKNLFKKWIKKNKNKTNKLNLKEIVFTRDFFFVLVSILENSGAFNQL